VGSVLLAEYTFDNLGLPDPQGWVGEDVNAPDTFFHVDNFNGLDPDYTPITGSQSLWCGTADSIRFCTWQNLPGYGNYWDQYFESITFATSGDVRLQFDMRYDCEANYDYVFIEYKDKDGQWQVWASYHGTDSVSFDSSIPETSLAGSVSFRFRFESDGVVSDESDYLDTNGAVIIDNIVISDNTGTIDSQDFEGESVGDRATADGDWWAYGAPGFGDYSGLFDGTTVLQEDPLVTNSTHVWGFFNGSTDTYACGGHPGQPVVPLRVGDGKREKIDNRIHSPWIDLDTLTISPGSSVVLDFDAYMENPIANGVFFNFEMRFLVNGCTTDWDGDGYIQYWPSAPRWAPLRFVHPLSPGATQVQVALRVLETSPLYGDGSCHSHAPLFDNVSVSILENKDLLVTHAGDTGPGSLRQAILNANASPDTSVIEFVFGPTSQPTIRPKTLLPAITQPTIIDGYSHPASRPNTNPAGVAGNAILMIELVGDSLGPGVTNHGLTLSADNCTIRGLAINRFGGSAIYCPNSGGHVIEGNYIGTDITGTNDLGNVGAYAVYLLGGDNTTIGGTSPAARNVISGNDSAAIHISGDGNVVQGNLIGTDVTGAVAMGNDEGGIYITGIGNTIGGTTAAARNVIAANGVGSTSHCYGVEIVSPGADNTVQGNYIGTDITGTVGMGNDNGISLSGSAGNVIGGTMAGAGNVISDQRVGMGISSSGSSSNVVQGNYIGTDASGTAPLGNDEEGIRVWSASNNTIGGTEAGAGNIVAFTVTGSGISVHEPSSSGNAVLSNSIFSNGDIGIGLGPWDGVTMNDSADVDTGPNGFQNFPVLTAVIAGGIQIEGSLNSTPDTQFRLEFFSNTACDPTGYGEGESFIGSTLVTTDSAGDVSFTASVSEVIAPGSFVTATATAPNGSTSEFCQCAVATVNTPEGSVVVVEPADSVSGTAPVTVTFDSVSAAGMTSLTINNTGPALPAGFFTDDPAVYHHITTTALFTDSIDVCIEYDDSTLSDETGVTLLHYDTTLTTPDWVDVTANVDTVLNVVCCRVATLSPFVVGLDCIPIFYVDVDATGSGNGSSWTNAFTDLQDALAAVPLSLCGDREIWVAEGTYMPTGIIDRGATFQLQDSLAIYGGFDGTEVSRVERDWLTNVTILSGDIGTPAVSADNSYHVVTGNNLDSTAVLDGVTVTAGVANGTGEYQNGGGMHNQNGSPTLVNIIFVQNYATTGGGGLYNQAGDPVLRNIVFKYNTADYQGGGMSSSGSPSLTNAVFFGNISTDNGGGCYGSGVLANVSFTGNGAGGRGGAIYGDFTLRNAILWGDEAVLGGAEIYNGGVVSYSLIQGSGGSGAGWSLLATDGGNNIDVDPLFIDGGAGNLRLGVGSPAIDAGDDTVPNLPATDLDGNPRIAGYAVDMGAYEDSLGSTLPRNAASPSNFQFNRIAVGSTRDTTFTIMNSGGGVLSGNVSETCSHYSITSGGGPFTLARDQSRVVSVRYAPTTSGIHKCLIETNSNGYGRLVLVADGTSGVQVFQAEDPAAPVFAGTYDTAGDAWRAFVRDSYAYVADGSSGLQILNIGDPTGPDSVGSYDTTRYSQGIFVSGDHAFVADGDPGLLVFDISDPTSPDSVGSYDTPSYANGVYVSGNYAFVADALSGLQVIDISNPTTPTLTGTYDTPSEAFGVHVSGSHAYVADVDAGLHIIDISNPAAPTLVGSYDTPDTTVGVAVSGDFAYVAAYNGGLQVVNISNPAAPILAGSYDTPGEAFEVALEGDYAYVADGTSGLHVIDVSDPTNPQNVWTYDTPGNAFGVTVVPGGDLTCSGYAGYKYALINSVVDVPDDQGGQVRINLTRSIYDFVDETQRPIVMYTVYRRIDGAAALAVISESGQKQDEDGGPAQVSPAFDRGKLPGWPILEHDGRSFVQSTPELASNGFPPGMWEIVYSFGATQQQDYIFFTSTLADSTQSEIPYAVFVTTAHTTTPALWFASPPDSGYSVDNIAPGVPQAFAVAYNTGSGNQLSWDPAPEADFQYYRIFRGNDENFTPDSTNAVHETATPSWTDPDNDGGDIHYKVTAVDDAGNESGAAGPGTVTAITPTIPNAFALHQNVPNPFNPTTVIHYEVPASGGKVKLRIFDVEGRLVRTLVDGVETPGEKRVIWNGRNSRGARVATGVYFYRMTAPGFTKTRKMVLLQ
jgi:predicted outer membrane repeat protein